MKFDATLDTLVDQLLTTGSVPALMGEPGIGKSSFVEALAEKNSTTCFTIAVNQLAEKADLTGGRLVPTPDGKDFAQAFFPHEEITAAIDYAEDHPQETPILFLDEINRAASDLTSAVLTLVTARKIGRKKLPHNLRLVVAGNDKGNITSMDDASVSRFVLLPVEPDAATLIQILESSGSMNPWVKQILTAQPNLVFSKAEPTGTLADGSNDDDDDDAQTMQIGDLYEADEAMVQFATPRTIEAVSKWLNVFHADASPLLEMLTTLVTDTSSMRPGSNDAEISQLQQTLECFTGPTGFTSALLSVMTRDLTAGNVGTQADTSSMRPGSNDAEISQLQQTLECFTGPTGFTSALLSVMTRDLTAGNVGTQASTLTVPKPSSYAFLKQASTVTDLEQVVSTLSDADKSGALLYALYESADNSRLLEKLTEQMSGLDKDGNRLLFEMLSQDKAHKQNIEAFMALSTTMAQNYQGMIANFV